MEKHISPVHLETQSAETLSRYVMYVCQIY
jgi:hypothetical protein